MSLRDTILTAEDRRSKVIDVDAWDVKVLVKGMSARQRGEMVESVGDDKMYLTTDIVLRLALDPDTGGRIFQDADRDALADKDGGTLDMIAKEILGLSGVDIDEAEEQVDSDPT